MRAVRIHQPGGVDVLQLDEIPVEAPGRDEVLVEVAAAGVNFIDTYQRSGLYPLPMPARLGREGAGVVTEVGPGVDAAWLGTRVAWAATNGSYAEQVVVPLDNLVAVPDQVDLHTAAAAVLQGLTAHYLSHATAPLGPDWTILVYAAAGGVGRLLVQFAKQQGARVLACTSTEEKAAGVRALGADEVLLYRSIDLVAEVRRLTDGVGVDVVYDSVGRDTFEGSLDCLRPRGLLALYGASSGPVPPVDPQELNRRGSLYLTRPALTHYIATRQELTERADALFAAVSSGMLDVAVSKEYRLEEVARAHTDLESGSTTGKLLLSP